MHSSVLGEHALFHSENTGKHLITRRREQSASDGTSNFIEPQICASGFSDVFRWNLEDKIVDKYKAWQTAAWLDLSGCYRVIKCVPIQLDSIMMLVRKRLVRHTDRCRVQSWEGEILGWLLLLFCKKRSVVCDRLRFCVHHLVIYEDYSSRLPMRGPHEANSLLTAPK